MPSKGANVKNEKQYEALKDTGMSKERAALIANSPGASSRGGKKSGSESSSKSSSSQGGTSAGLRGRMCHPSSTRSTAPRTGRSADRRR
jgi:hypothetical protein